MWLTLGCLILFSLTLAVPAFSLPAPTEKKPGPTPVMPVPPNPVNPVPGPRVTIPPEFTAALPMIRMIAPSYSVHAAATLRGVFRGNASLFILESKTSPVNDSTVNFRVIISDSQGVRDIPILDVNMARDGGTLTISAILRQNDTEQLVSIVAPRFNGDIRINGNVKTTLHADQLDELNRLLQPRALQGNRTAQRLELLSGYYSRLVNGQPLRNMGESFNDYRARFDAWFSVVAREQRTVPDDVKAQMQNNFLKLAFVGFHMEDGKLYFVWRRFDDPNRNTGSIFNNPADGTYTGDYRVEIGNFPEGQIRITTIARLRNGRLRDNDVFFINQKTGVVTTIMDDGRPVTPPRVQNLIR